VLTHQPGRYLTKNELVKYRIIIAQPPVFDKQKNTTGGLFMQKNGENQTLSSEIIADLEEKLMVRNVIIAILAITLAVTTSRRK
jgi:hypothetical protein